MFSTSLLALSVCRVKFKTRRGSRQGHRCLKFAASLCAQLQWCQGEHISTCGRSPIPNCCSAGCYPLRSTAVGLKRPTSDNALGQRNSNGSVNMQIGIWNSGQIVCGVRGKDFPHSRQRRRQDACRMIENVINVPICQNPPGLNAKTYDCKHGYTKRYGVNIVIN